MSWLTCHITSYTFPNSVYCQTLQHTHTNKGKSSQFRYNLLHEKKCKEMKFNLEQAIQA
jgi:hypothetical protein